MRTLLAADTTAACEPSELGALSQTCDAYADRLGESSLRLFRSERTQVAGFRFREAADSHRLHSAFVRDVAESFRHADTARREYQARISLVDQSISEWLPANRDKVRTQIVRNTRRRLLTFDPAKDGRVVEVFGDAQAANHVALLIPGMDNDITDFLGLRVRAENLKAEMARLAPAGETVAVVLWLGYDTPDLNLPRLLTEGAGSAKARAGAKDLVDDVGFLRRVNPRGHLSVVGHSYGSVVVGRAMQLGLDVRNVVVVGSPGMDVQDRRDLKSPAVNLWATRHRGQDLIPLLPTHGEDPAAPGFHAKRFPSHGVKNHSDYFREGTVALANIARIATGGTPRT